jgi:hypothetical protein
MDHVIALYPRPQRDIYVDQTLRVLSEIRKAPDPLALSRTLVKLTDYLKDGQTMVIQPWWSPVYPDRNASRLFHVMPFRPKWADQITAIASKACGTAHISYVRGDQVSEPNVIRSIWEEICKASHVLVDLTGFNANVALELGMAHTLGKNVLMVGQGDTVDHLFPSVQKMRLETYNAEGFARLLSSALDRQTFDA